MTDTEDMSDTWMEILGEEPSEVEKKMLKEIGNPIKRMERIYELITLIKSLSSSEAFWKKKELIRSVLSRIC